MGTLEKYSGVLQVEFIVMGGTFMALPEEYRDYFIRYRFCIDHHNNDYFLRNLHDALSGHCRYSWHIPLMI